MEEKKNNIENNISTVNSSNENDTNIQKSFQTLIDGLKAFAKTDSVVGEPIYAGDTIIVPIMELSCGMGVGDWTNKEQSFQKSAGALSAKLTPTSLLVLQNGKTRLMSINNQDFISKTLDMVPDFLDKIFGMNKISKKAENEALKIKKKLEDDTF